MASEPPPPHTHMAETLLARAHVPDQVDTILRERVKQRPLLLRPSSPDPTLNARAQRQHARRQKQRKNSSSSSSSAKNKPRPLSAKQKRALCLYEIPKDRRKHAIYEPLHALWCGYMREVLGLDAGRTHVDAASAGPLLVTADFHGARVRVVRSRCVSRVGLEGIVVKDTKFTFEVVTRRDEWKVVPKEHTVFRFEVPFAEAVGKEGDAGRRQPLVFEIHGSQFETRAPDRANKKFKLHIDPDL